MDASPLLQEFYPGPASLIVLWIVIWGIIGGVVTPRIYRRRDLDASNALLYGALAGAGTGPILLAYLWWKTPELTWPFAVFPAMMAIALFYGAFITYHPSNLCSKDPTYILSQMSNGVLIGILYGVIAIGLTLIFSILGIVSFAHGQFYMIGGYVAFFLLNHTMNPGLTMALVIFSTVIPVALILYYWGVVPLFNRFFSRDPHWYESTIAVVMVLILAQVIVFAIGFVTNLILGILLPTLVLIGLPSVAAFIDDAIPPSLALISSGLITMEIGMLFERTLLRPMHLGKVERPGEYAILLTFGLAFFLEYTVLAMLGANPRKVDPYLDIGSTVTIGAISLPSSRVIAAGIGLIILMILLWFLNYTWMGKALRAVSQDKQAAAVVGINPLTMNTFAFGLGAMLAGLSGAALVQVLAWVPNISGLASARSFVVIVLGGMGSLPGAMVGGLIIGVVEALGVGCFPDVSRALAYQQVFGMIIFAIVLLLKPTGLFGREL